MSPLGNITPGEGVILDNFAPVFVPAWLKQVNASRSIDLHQPSPPTIDYLSYHTCLYPPQLMNQLRTEEIATHNAIDRKLQLTSGRQRQQNSQILKSAVAITSRIDIKRKDGSVVTPPPARESSSAVDTISLPQMNPITYSEFFLRLMYAEYEARRLDLLSSNLYLAKVVPLAPQEDVQAGGPRNSALDNLYSLEARSIREGVPACDIGDSVHLRQLRPYEESWQGWDFAATVHSINRAGGKIILKIDALRIRMESMLFNVNWHAQDRIFFASRRAIEILQFLMDPSIIISPRRPAPLLDDQSRIRSRAEQWLFPGIEDLNQTLRTNAKEIEFVDTSLNEEQRQAVTSILFGQKSIPLLIYGPPGTGKTKTLVEGILQILKLFPKTSILVCGASNPSADTLALRLRNYASPDVMFRLNDPSRPFSEIKSDLLPFCHIDNERFSLPSIEVLMKKRIIVCSCADASILREAKITNFHLSRLESDMNKLLRPHDEESTTTLQPHFGFLLVDESAQAMESEIVIPISVVVTSSGQASHLTLAGDQHQLGPNVISAECRAAGLDASFLDRLSERDVYKHHPASSRNRTKSNGIGWDLSTPFVNLLRNYRSATPILMIPSTLFYSESLIPAAPDSTQNSLLHNYYRLSNRFPVSFINIDGKDEPVDEHSSFWNEQEVDIVKSLVIELVSTNGPHGILLPSQISVISPFREQVWRIRLALRKVGLGDVDVGNVEALQGSENRVVIISTVRSRSQIHLRSDRLQHRGIIFEPRRFNVALTRAKELLIVVGNGDTLSVDENWKAFISFCRRNQSFSGSPLQRQYKGDGELISRLEVAYRATKIASKENIDDDFAVLVGSVAREALWEAT